MTYVTEHVCPKKMDWGINCLTAWRRMLSSLETLKRMWYDKYRVKANDMVETKQSASAHRFFELQSELERWVDILVAHYAPEKIIVFGSFARASVAECSDIDMLIVKDTDKPFLDRTKDVLSLLHPRVGLDVLVYTPEEFKNLSETRLFFKDEVLPQSKVIYERRG